MSHRTLAAYLITAVLIVGLLAATAGCGGSISGSSNIETREMNYSDFTKLEISSAFDADITRGDSYFVSITANDNLFQNLDIRQSGKTLYIGLKQPRIYVRTTQKAAIVMPELQRLNLSGASKGEVHGFSTESPIEFNLSGASDLYLDDIEAGATEFDLSGASDVSGSIETGDCSFNISGASDIELNGSAGDISVEASGASKVMLSDFPASNVDINLSGASKGTINTNGKLDAELSGASDLKYLGNPTLGSIDTSGGAKISSK